MEAVLYPVVVRAYTEPFTIASNFAKEHAWGVAVAASLGFITVLIVPDSATRMWRITAKGMDYIYGD